jgi:hypothetical protein
MKSSEQVDDPGVGCGAEKQMALLKDERQRQRNE